MNTLKILNNNCLIYDLQHEYHGYKSRDEIIVNTPIKILEKYRNNIHVLKCYTTDIFNDYQGDVNDALLNRILRYGELYHAYIPCKDDKLGFSMYFYNVVYIQLYNVRNRLFFSMEFPDIIEIVNSILPSELYRDFMESYRFEHDR